MKTKQDNNKNRQDEIRHKKLNNILNFCIDCTIYPKKRKYLIRKIKINNILV